MRREEITTQGQVIQPVFFAPLTQGDVSDNISGVTGIPLNNGTCQWDNNESAYKLTTNRGASLGFAINNFADLIPDSYTIFARVKVATTSTTFYVFSAGTYNNNCYPIIGTHNVGIASNTNNWHNIVCVCDKSNLMQLCYCDSVLKSSYSRPSNHQIWSSNWTETQKNNVSIGTYYYYSGAAYVKDVRVYNRALTAQEVAVL